MRGRAKLFDGNFGLPNINNIHIRELAIKKYEKLFAAFNIQLVFSVEEIIEWYIYINIECMERITIELKSKKKRQMLITFLEEQNIPYASDNNPSPSGDRWFKNFGNIEILEKGIADEKAGRINRVKDVNNPWESIM